MDPYRGEVRGKVIVHLGILGGLYGLCYGGDFSFFNLFNHPNFDKPVNDIAQGVGTFGTINNLVAAPTSILGSFVGADGSPRIIQLRAQLVF